MWEESKPSLPQKSVELQLHVFQIHPANPESVSSNFGGIISFCLLSSQTRDILSSLMCEKQNARSSIRKNTKPQIAPGKSKAAAP